MKTHAAAILLVAWTTSVAQGAELTAAQTDAAEKVASPVMESQTGFGGSGFLLNADSDATTASLSASRTWDEQGSGESSFNAFTVKVSSPLDKKSNSANFVTDLGITKSTFLELAYNRISMKETALPLAREERRRLYYCGPEPSDSSLPEDEGEFPMAPEEKEDFLSDRREKRRKCLEQYDAGKTPDARIEMTEAEKREIGDPFLKIPVWFSGFSTSVGYKELDFRDPGDFSKHSSQKVPYAISAYAGLSPNEKARYLGGGFEFKRDYKAVDSQTLCQPGTNPLECFTGAYAPPKDDDATTVFLVARAQHLLDLKRDIPIGVELKLGYDFEDDAFGASLPVYVFSDSKGKLRGGFRVSWDSDEDDVKFGIFVGAPFKLFGS